MSATAAEDDVETALDSVAFDEESTPREAEAEPSASWTRRIVRHWRPIAVVTLLLVSAGSAAALYFGGYRADHETAGASAVVIDAASEGSVALLSYAPNSVDQDIAGARSHLTGDFLTYYSEFADKFVVPASKQKDIRAAASVVRTAPIEVKPDTAKVLVFLNQETTSRDNPAPAQAASTVKVGLTKVDGRWLISSFDPI